MFIILNGPLGIGKSTLAEALSESNASVPHRVSLKPKESYHYPVISMT
jgi:deoxyadenosine/deoxycytidine kinase